MVSLNSTTGYEKIRKIVENKDANTYFIIIIISKSVSPSHGSEIT